MKIKKKTTEEILADLIVGTRESKEAIEELLQIVEQRDAEIEEIRAEMLSVAKDLNTKIYKRDKIIKTQAESIKALAEGMKEGIREAEAPSIDDLEYLAKLIKDAGYLEPAEPQKSGIMQKFFGGGK